MSYVGEIRLFAGNFAPSGWMFCAGQSMPIAENETLFQLLGTDYGGDGQETFRLPDLRGRLPIHYGQGPGLSDYPRVGVEGGTEQETLTVNQIPVHTHTMLGSTNIAATNAVNNNVPATMLAAGTNSAYDNTDPPRALSADTISPVGGSQPHENFQPYLCVNFIISLFGIYPSPT